MGALKAKKKPSESEDLELLKSDVASFVSSIGFSSAASSSLPSSGFDDSDFKKTGPLKPKGRDKTPKPQPSINGGRNLQKEEVEKKKKNDQRVKTGPPVLSLDHSKPIDRWKNFPKLPLVKASSLGIWYADAAEYEAKIIGSEAKKTEAKSADEVKNLVAKKKELAERLLSQYTHDFELSRGKSGDIKMLMTTQRSGTAADKVSAFSLLVGENPIANMRSLDALLAMVTSKVGKRHALTGFEALSELFLSSLLPDRKLKTLVQRPLNQLPESKDGYSLLLFWYWEECLKLRYERFIFALEEASRDMLPVLKDKSLKTLYALLRSKPEQERRLLSALVNKLGDPTNRAASNADFHLSNLLSTHPNMKAVVIGEVDSFLFRPHLGLRAKYHAVNFLNQIRLGHKGDEPKVAKRLVDVYFALFKVLISEANGVQKTGKGSKEEKKANESLKHNKGESPIVSNVEMDSRLLSALLTGVNRAFPFVASDEVDDIIEIQTPMLFKLVHSENFNVAVQALMLLDKISSKHQIVSDRFYRALYSKLLMPATMNSSKAEMFIGLLLRAMKSDINLKRVSAFSKRILQVALQQPPQYACGCLFLLSEVLKARPPLWNMMLQNELVDDDLEHFEDIMEKTGNETGMSPVKQEQGTNEIVQTISDGLKTGDDSSSDLQDDDSLASYSEDGSDGVEDLFGGDGLNDVQDSKGESVSERSHPQVSSINSSMPGGYNPRHREPSYCNADRASWWELMVLGSHVHPSVATMAKTLLSGANIVYNGNPLNDLSLTAFLDKFMEKKPKASTWHGGSQIEPSKKMVTNKDLIGAEILSLAEVDVPPEDFVFHKFYVNKMNSLKKPKKKKKKKGAEDEAAEALFAVDGGDESDNEEIDNLLDAGDLPLGSKGDYDYDDLDQVANVDDSELLGSGSGSDIETDLPSDFAEREDGDDDNVNIGDADDDGGDDDDNMNIGDADDDGGDDDDNGSSINRRKRKSGGRAATSPFASLEEYSHLLNEDNATEEGPKYDPLLNEGGAKRKKPRSQKKRSSK
ncbi:CCAAT/enhancer-binding protein zeta isoform X2 [Macadamia integrifolia]|uniref:CCAAT/enhancer-binding protein zeta isoform X2 n=1 Tax=Macadamia integrifolia TaxID=60698 RepID=UPI001C4F02CF|nr:CCAAT/enhancer-binding protein zeta isoform X2 [Macadamia integrifolia]